MHPTAFCNPLRSSFRLRSVATSARRETISPMSSSYLGFRPRQDYMELRFGVWGGADPRRTPWVSGFTSPTVGRVCGTGPLNPCAPGMSEPYEFKKPKAPRRQKKEQGKSTRESHASAGQVCKAAAVKSSDRPPPPPPPPPPPAPPPPGLEVVAESFSFSW